MSVCASIQSFRTACGYFYNPQMPKVAGCSSQGAGWGPLPRAQCFRFFRSRDSVRGKETDNGRRSMRMEMGNGEGQGEGST